MSLEDIRKRDAETGSLWFKGPGSFTALAARDRRALLALLACHPDPTGKTREPPHCPTCGCEAEPK